MRKLASFARTIFALCKTAVPPNFRLEKLNDTYVYNSVFSYIVNYQAGSPDMLLSTLFAERSFILSMIMVGSSFRIESFP